MYEAAGHHELKCLRAAYCRFCGEMLVIIINYWRHTIGHAYYAK